METDPGLEEIAQEYEAPGPFERQALELVGERLRLAAGPAQVCIRHDRDSHPPPISVSSADKDIAPPAGAGHSPRAGCFAAPGTPLS
jgi:hypothetical protein